MKKTTYLLHCIILLSLFLGSCKKQEVVFKDPYGDGKSPLGIVINADTPPVPATGSGNTVVTISATGLMPYKADLTLMFNGEKAEIIEITETYIKAKVPITASTGFISIAVKDQLVIGPAFLVNGLINIDPSFVAKAGTDRPVNQFYGLPDGRFLLIGNFTNFDNKGIVSPLNRIIKISVNGDLDRSFRTGKAANGNLSQVAEVNNKFIIAGGFSGYYQQNGNINNITSLNSNGSIDTMAVHPFRRRDQLDTIIYYPKFNGGTNWGIDKMYTINNKIIATGNFRYYIKRIYTKPNFEEKRDSIILDSTEIKQIIRLLPDGSLDSTYRFNQATRKGLPGANGPINSFMHKDIAQNGNLVIFGNFNSFDGISAGHIIRLNPDGTIDNSFKAGSGADNNITSLTYNALLQKYVITGQFKTYNGNMSPGIALLNMDGSFDNTFKVKLLAGGYAYYAKQINSGLIIISGGFTTYNKVSRTGFLVLNPSGDMAQGYNATGIFSGNLNDVIESQTADGKNALLLIGDFNRFDNQEVHNIIRVAIQ